VVRQAQALGARLICASFEDYAGPEGGFAAVCFVDTFEHLLGPHRALRKARRLLAAAGVLMIEMPDADAPGFQELGPAWKHFKPREHAYLYGRSHMLALLAMHGLRLVDSIVPYPDRRVYYARKDK